MPRIAITLVNQASAKTCQVLFVIVTLFVDGLYYDQVVSRFDGESIPVKANYTDIQNILSIMVRSLNLSMPMVTKLLVQDVMCCM